MAHDADAVEGRRMRGAPIAQQVIYHRIEALFRRVPRFEQVIVETDIVDCPDSRFGVGVGRQQNTARPRESLDGLREKFHARHLRHPLIYHEQGDVLAAKLQRLQRIKRLRARFRADHAIVLAVLPAQVTFDGPQDDVVIINRHDYRFGHSFASSFALIVTENEVLTTTGSTYTLNRG